MQLERFAATEVDTLEKVIETDLMSFGKGFTMFEQVCFTPAWLTCWYTCCLAAMRTAKLAVSEYSKDRLLHDSVSHTVLCNYVNL